jgi:hypothetical protein|tara:strand:- start:796 stop:1050 length:255 start_codon:yes stop_codon:yes gene_type:complete
MLLEKSKIDVWFISDLFEIVGGQIAGVGGGWISIEGDKTLIDYYEDDRNLCVYVQSINNKTALALLGLCEKYKLNYIERYDDER